MYTNTISLALILKVVLVQRSQCNYILKNVCEIYLHSCSENFAAFSLKVSRHSVFILAMTVIYEISLYDMGSK